MKSEGTKVSEQLVYDIFYGSDGRPALMVRRESDAPHPFKICMEPKEQVNLSKPKK